MSGDEEKSVISKLMAKIASQAKELSELNAKLEESKENQALYSKPGEDFFPSNENRKNTLSHTSSDLAVKRRLEKEHNQQFAALQKQLDIAETKNIEALKTKKKLMSDLDTKIREVKFLEKQCQQQQVEIQSLKDQVDSTVRVNTLSSKTKVGKQNRTIASFNVMSEKLEEENRRLKLHLNQCKKEIEASKDKESQLKIQLKIMEEALELRSEEIGLSGQSELLAQVARLRGEVTALKTELTSKHNQLSAVEDDRSKLNLHHEDLQQQIKDMQKRIAQTQQDCYRYNNGNMVEMLQNVEKERDQLLEFIQHDMDKKGILSKKVEQLESDLRVEIRKSQTYEEKYNKIESMMDEEIRRRKAAESRLKSDSIQNSESRKMFEFAEMEKDSLIKQIDRKIMEIEELNKMQMSLFQQLKSKDEELYKKNNEVINLKSKLNEIEIITPNLENENNTLKNRLKHAEDELYVLRESLTILEPKVSIIEPELKKLRNNYNKLMEEKMQLLSNIDNLQTFKNRVEHLERDVSEVEVLSHSSMDNSNKESTNSREKSNLSRKHAVWVGLPSIRGLCPSLYEKLRVLINDLQKIENEFNEHNIHFKMYDDDRHEQLRNLEAKLLKFSKINENLESKQENLINRTKKAEEAAKQFHSSKIALDQIRIVLSSITMDKGELKKLIKNFADDSKGFLPFDENESLEEYVNQLTDVMLPDFIGRVIMHNAQAVFEVTEKNKQISTLLDMNENLTQQIHVLTKDKDDLESQWRRLVNRMNSQEEELESKDKEFRSQLESATELAEKQNSLSFALEAKIEGMMREKQLKVAQISSLQQREETIRQRLIRSLRRCVDRGSRTITPDVFSSFKTNDLVQICDEILSNCNVSTSVWEDILHSSGLLGKSAKIPTRTFDVDESPENWKPNKSSYFDKSPDSLDNSPQIDRFSINPDSRAISPTFTRSGRYSSPLKENNFYSHSKQSTKRHENEDFSKSRIKEFDALLRSSTGDNYKKSGKKNLETPEVRSKGAKIESSSSSGSGKKRSKSVTTKRTSVGKKRKESERKVGIDRNDLNPDNDNLRQSHNTSKQLQERLKKAQLAFSQMKESLHQ